MDLIKWARHEMVPILRRDPHQSEAVYAVEDGPCWYGTSTAGLFLTACHDPNTPRGQLRTGQTYAAILHASNGLVRVLGEGVSAHRAIELCRPANKDIQASRRP
jgi:hypothetical protein